MTATELLIEKGAQVLLDQLHALTAENDRLTARITELEKSDG